MKLRRFRPAALRSLSIIPQSSLPRRASGPVEAVSTLRRFDAAWLLLKEAAWTGMLLETVQGHEA